MRIRAILALALLVCISPAWASNPADIYKDNKVDWLDLKMVGDNWLSIVPTPADIDNSGDVSFPDYVVLANNWGWVGPPPPNDMVFIPGGEFLMGDHFEDGTSDELPVHAVYVDAFYMSKFETTNQQYCEYLNSAYDTYDVKISDAIVYAYSDSNNSFPYCKTYAHGATCQIEYSGGVFSVRTKFGRAMSNDPMVEVTWNGAVAYCNWRSQQEGKEICYNTSDPNWPCDFNKKGYRLPTEAEWEYAARGGKNDPYYRFPWGDTISHSQANYYADPCAYSYDVSPTSGYHPDWNDGNYPYTSPVRSFSTNDYALYDMTGNAWEWCNDRYDSNYYSVSPYNNPQGPVSGYLRVIRGGGWSHIAHGGRVSYRSHAYPEVRGILRGGFRMVLDLN